MKKEILFLLLDKWSDWEAAYLSVVIQMLAEESYCVRIVAIDKKEVVSIGGFKTICDAARFLGTVGVLNNIKHTYNNLHDLKKWAGDKSLGENKFIPKMAVSDNGVITANGTASLEFAKEVLLS